MLSEIAYCLSGNYIWQMLKSSSAMLALSCDLSVVSLYWHLPLLSHGIMVKCQSNAHSSIISQQYRPSRYFLPNVFRICIRTCTLLASCFLHIIYSSKKSRHIRMQSEFYAYYDLSPIWTDYLFIFLLNI